MKITVILCTYNRCVILANALESVAASVLPGSVKWDVLVVDNNSKDKTREIVEGFCNRHPCRFRYLFEPTPGKSNALNAGIREAQADILAFMDDDVTVESTWLANLTANMHDGRWSGAGGRILPQRTFPVPKWLSLKGRYALAPLALFDLGSEPGPLYEPPFGTNMAFQEKVFEKYGGFRTDLGPRPDSEIRNEDTEFGRRLLEGGEELRYEPSAVVYHSVSQERIQKQYFQNWWFDKARADIRELRTAPRSSWSVSGIPLAMFPRLALWTLRWLVALDPGVRFSNKLKAWGVAGQILEYSQRRG